MKLENWNINIGKVQEWLEQEDRGDNGQAISLSITLGNNCKNDDLRSTYWTAIRSIGSTFEDFPLARRGQKSALPEQMELSAISVKNAVVNAFASLTDADMILRVILPHGRTGGSYATIDELAESFGQKAYDALVKGHKEDRWDGSMEGNVPQMTAPPVKQKEAKKEE
jgi:hypothetical protein